MPNKSILEYSDIQVKVLNELELLSDAYISTFNEIGKVVKQFSKEMSTLISKFVSEKNFWRKLDSESYDLAYKPFFYDVDKMFLIDSLDFTFAVEGRVVLRKEIKSEDKKKYVNYFNFCWGFIYDKTQNPEKYFYIELTRDRSWGESILSEKEYEEIANRIKKSVGFTDNSFYDLNSPDEDGAEYFGLKLDNKDVDKVSNFFEIGKEEFIEKFISKIKD